MAKCKDRRRFNKFKTCDIELLVALPIAKKNYHWWSIGRDFCMIDTRINERWHAEDVVRSKLNKIFIELIRQRSKHMSVTFSGLPNWIWCLIRYPSMRGQRQNWKFRFAINPYESGDEELIQIGNEETSIHDPEDF